MDMSHFTYSNSFKSIWSLVGPLVGSGETPLCTCFGVQTQQQIYMKISELNYRWCMKEPHIRCLGQIANQGQSKVKSDL